MSQFVELNGNRFFLQTWGKASNPILLMLHGFPEYSGAWEELAERLKHRFYCVAPDQRGYGQSYSPPQISAYQMRHLVGDLEALINYLAEPVFVLGHDWGAAAAYGLTMSHPELVKKLVIMNGVHPIPFQKALLEDAQQIMASQYILWLRQEGSENILAEDNFARLKALFAKDIEMNWLNLERVDRYIGAWKDAAGLRGMINWYRATGLYVPKVGEDIQPIPLMDTRDMRIKVPHLLIWGMKDTALLPKSYRGIEELSDDFKMLEIDDGSHWLHHEKPDQVAAMINEWL